MKEIEAYTVKKTGKVMLNANELYADVSKSIKEEIMEEFMQIPFNRYPDETNHELIQAYSSYKQLEDTQVLAGNGSDEMLGLMIGYFLGKDKKLCTLSPDFSMYDYYASMHEANVVKYNCQKDGSFNIDDFINFANIQQVHMILFSNPNNPTGHALTNEELIQIVEAFPNIPVIIDEAYGEFAKETMLSCIDRYTNLYVTRTLSKAFGLAGMRLGFLISQTSNINTLKSAMVPYNISSLTQKVGVVVLRHAHDYEALTLEVIQARDALYERVKDCKRVTFYPSHANYLYGRSAYKKAFLQGFEARGVVIRTYGDDTFRITIGSKEENELIFEIIEAFEKEVAL